MATIRIIDDKAFVTGMCADGSQFRKTYSKKRYGDGFKKIARHKYEELLFESAGFARTNNGRAARNMRTMTVKELAKRYAEEHLLHTRATGNTSYLDVIVKKWGAWKIGMVTVGLVRRWIWAYLSGVIKNGKKEYSANYAKKLLLYFKRIYNWGCEAEIIDRNPIQYAIDHSLRKEFSRRIRARRQIIETEQFEAIIAPSPLWLQRVCRHAWGTGMRCGEIAGLRWSAINGSFIELESEETKEAAVKIVPMEPAVVDQIKAIDLEQSMEGKNDFVYLHESGAPLDTITISDAWRRWRDRAGYNNLRFHDIRRTWENRKERAGHSLRVIAAALGHQSTDTTARHYRSVSLAEMEQLASDSKI